MGECENESLLADGREQPQRHCDNDHRGWTGASVVCRLGVPVDATTDTWVNDAEAQPWLFVTAEANDSLLSMLNEQILPAVREHVGAHRTVTLIFDPEGWSPHNFSDWQQHGFEGMTYRKGRYQMWPQEEFIGVCEIRNR